MRLRLSILAASTALCGILIFHGGAFGQQQQFTPEQRRVLDSTESDSNVPHLNGDNHNLEDPLANAAGTSTQRFAEPGYEDGIFTLAGPNRPGPRAISNAVFFRNEVRLNPLGTNNFLWALGQIYDHDFGITEDSKNPKEPIPIPVPEDDKFFTPGGIIPLVRSKFEAGSGTSRIFPRAQVNEETGWIDGSMIYSYGQELPVAIRAGFRGQMRLDSEGLLPRAATVLPKDRFPDTLFVCGDFHPRCNETPTLTLLHTLFVREHNRKAAEYYQQDPNQTDEQIFQKARLWNIAILQHMFVDEFIPVLTGMTLPPYEGHDPSVNGRLANEFTGAVYRLGHTLLPSHLRRRSRLGLPLTSIDLSESLFQSPDLFQHSGDLDALLRGMKTQLHETVDCIVVGKVRNFLIVDPPGVAAEKADKFFDLPAINIERGRDHGVATFNTLREALGLPKARAFNDSAVFDADAAKRLSSVYKSINDVDAFPGAICERPENANGHTGALINAMIKRQIVALRSADRFWYENEGVMPAAEVAAVKAYSMSKFVANNSGLSLEEMGENAFSVER